MIETLKKLSKEELISEVINLKHQVSLFQKGIIRCKKEQHITVENPEQIKIEYEEKIDLDLPQDIEQQQVMQRKENLLRSLTFNTI
ncbi:MAG: hypothetical protein A3F72_02485 [Bacteroidetes bacterium RIFCSPLOWO2_12_FULL_35_15]|nr:MAG: hypothetical protein A3F72_02485 [Bacteroidetes bacterium RIFCSPLOWO2_12_FULL_35_15]